MGIVHTLVTVALSQAHALRTLGKWLVRVGHIDRAVRAHKGSLSNEKTAKQVVQQTNVSKHEAQFVQVSAVA
jgi:hypothetical protein